MGYVTGQRSKRRKNKINALECETKSTIEAIKQAVKQIGRTSLYGIFVVQLWYLQVHCKKIVKNIFIVYDTINISSTQTYAFVRHIGDFVQLFVIMLERVT